MRHPDSRRVLVVAAAGILLPSFAAGSATGGTPAATPPLVEIHDAWVRPAYQLPSGSGVYMTITAAKSMRLTGVTTNAAKSARLSDTQTSDGMMLMVKLQRGIEFPADQTVVLEPGQKFIALDGLKRPLITGRKIRLRLQFVDSTGIASDQEIEAVVSLVPPGQPEPIGHHHKPAAMPPAMQHSHQ